MVPAQNQNFLWKKRRWSMNDMESLKLILDRVETLTRQATSEEAKRMQLEEVVAGQKLEIKELRLRIMELEAQVKSLQEALSMKGGNVVVENNNGIIGHDVSSSDVTAIASKSKEEAGNAG